MNVKKVFEIIAEVETYGGYSSSPHIEGYQVAVPQFEIKLPMGMLSPTVLTSLLREVGDIAKTLDYEWGLWLDNETLYIDITEHVDNYQLAVALGAKRKQKAIWDWRLMESIEIKEEQA